MWEKLWNWLKGLFSKPTEAPLPPPASGPRPEIPPSGWCQVVGNQILGPNGDPLILKGVNIACPFHLDTKPQERPDVSAAKIAQSAVNLGAKIIRLPIEQSTDGWNKIGGQAYFERHLDPLVKELTAQGIYVILDFHEILDWSGSALKACQKFWEFLAPKYAQNPLVIYEIFNEPINPDSWARFKRELAMPIVGQIRQVAPKNLILVGAPGWSSHHQDTHKDLIEGENIAYAGHFYSNQWPQKIKDRIGELIKVAPVVITEFGWESGGTEGGNTEDYGGPMLEFMRQHNLSWTAWIYDNVWGPRMVHRGWTLRGGNAGMGEAVVSELNR